MIPGRGFGIMRCCTAQCTPPAISPPTAAIAAMPKMMSRLERSESSESSELPELVPLLSSDDTEASVSVSTVCACTGEMAEKAIAVVASMVMRVLRMPIILARAVKIITIFCQRSPFFGCIGDAIFQTSST